jgi:peptidoglycan/xylan/chitin deacetylase (PgdA/CDA1 family)
VTITFDDGFTSGLTGTSIFNISGIPTTQFIITGNDCELRGACTPRTDGQSWGCLYDSDANGDPGIVKQGPCEIAGVNQAGYIAWSDVKDLAAKNEIAPHTRSHNYLSYLSAGDIQGELQGSLSDLQYHATQDGYKVSPVFAYPYGDYGCYVRDPLFNTCVLDQSTSQEIGVDVKAAKYIGARTSDEGTESGPEYDDPANCPNGDGCWGWADLPLFMHTVAGGQGVGYTCSFAGGTSCDGGKSNLTDTTLPSCKVSHPGFQCWVDSVVKNDRWVIFLFHRVDENAAPNKSMSVNHQELQLLTNYLKSQNITTVTFSEGLAMEGINGQNETVVYPSPTD